MKITPQITSNGLRKSIIILSFLVVLTSVMSIADDSDNPRIPLASVNGDTIYNSNVDNLLIDVHGGMSAQHRMNFDYRKLLNKLVNDYLIIQEAYAMGLDEEEWLLKELNDIREQKAMGLFIRENFNPDLTISDESIGEYFEKYYRRFQVRSLAVESIEEALELSSLCHFCFRRWPGAT